MARPARRLSARIGARDPYDPEASQFHRVWAIYAELGQHEPYPAFVVDRRWNLLRANRGAASLSSFLLGPPPAEPSSDPVNLAVALMSSESLRPFITNWEEVAHYFLRGVQADAQADGAPETLVLLNRLLALPDVMAGQRSPSLRSPLGDCSKERRAES